MSQQGVSFRFIFCRSIRYQKWKGFCLTNNIVICGSFSICGCIKPDESQWRCFFQIYSFFLFSCLFCWHEMFVKSQQKKTTPLSIVNCNCLPVSSPLFELFQCTNNGNFTTHGFNQQYFHCFNNPTAPTAQPTKPSPFLVLVNPLPISQSMV